MIKITIEITGPSKASKILGYISKVLSHMVDKGMMNGFTMQHVEMEE